MKRIPFEYKLDFRITWCAYSDPPIMADQPVLSFQILLLDVVSQPLSLLFTIHSIQYTQLYVSIKSAIKNAIKSKSFPRRLLPPRSKAIELFRNLKAIEIFCVLTFNFEAMTL